jgi:hypothetical protein
MFEDDFPELKGLVSCDIQVRDAIAVCCDLPEEAKQSLIGMGDAAA